MYKLELQVVNKPDKLYVGIMTLPSYKKYSATFDPKKVDNEVAWVCSNGSSSKCSVNTIDKFDENETIYLTLRKDQLVVKKKSDKQYATLRSNFPGN